MKIHHKIISLLIGIQIIFMLLFSVFIYYSISNYSFTDFYKRLEIRAAISAKIQLDNNQDRESIERMKREYLEVLPNQQQFIFPTDSVIYFANSNTIPNQIIDDIIQTGKGEINVGNKLFAGILYTTSLNKKYIVIVSAENYFYTHHIAYLRNLLLSTLGFGTILIALFSIIFTRTIVRPINNIINEVQNISSENLHLRLKTTNKNDSISNLTKTFNDVLNRLETSFETQKNFISNASHELNTPLTTIIGEAELALSRKRTEESYEKSLALILSEAEKLDSKTKALLQLAQTGFNGKSQKFEKIRIDELLLDVHEVVSKTFPSSSILLDLSLLPEDPLKLKISGNNKLLYVAIYNLLTNACKYSDNKPIKIALAVSNTTITIVIKDDGIGIPSDELPYIFDPYFRASNVRMYEGYGIGLPLSRNIIHMHQGKLTVSSELNIGTCVEIKVPIGIFLST